MNKRMKSIMSGLLAALLIVSPLAPLPASAAEDKSPLAENIDTASINPAYVEWVNDGQTGYAPSAQDFSYLAESYAATQAATPRVANHGAQALPAQYDLRQSGKVDPVYDQGSSGICWAIAANSAACGSIKTQVPQLALSAVHTAWFCYTGNEEKEFAPNTSAYLSGGNDGRAVATMAAWKGPITADKAPLVIKSLAPLSEDMRYMADYHLQDAYYMPNGVYYDIFQNADVATTITKRILMDVGPVSLNYYSHGTDTYNPVTYACYNDTERSSDHAVLIVGWDDHFSKSNFVSGNQPEHDGAWLVRNSWGTNWGDDGYFWISYEDKSLVSGNAYLLESADNYTRNYQYDTNGWSFSANTDRHNQNVATAANIFTAASNEQLEAVSFYTTDANAEYSISVYTGVTPGEPESGTCVLKGQRGREPYAGYHTIELSEAVKLTQGEAFSIVVTFKNPTYNQPLAIEWCPTPDNQTVPAYMGTGGESYILKDGTWQDIAGHTGTGYYITNVCIKGFTNPLPADGEAVGTVRFSEIEGPVADHTTLTLDCTDNATIYWSDGGPYQAYTGPIALDDLTNSYDKMRISAYAEKNGKRGNTVTRTYTRARAQLTDLAVKYDGQIQHFSTAGGSARNFSLPRDVETVQVMAQSGDTITINGKVTPSAQWSAPIKLTPHQTTSVTVTATAPNKDIGDYTINLHPSGITPQDPNALQPHPLVLAEEPENGSVIFSPTSATKGSTVTITITPDKGYELDTLQVADENGHIIQTRALGNGRYSFTMTNCTLYLKVTFSKRPADAPPFLDVNSNAWYYKPVKYVYDNHLMVGTTDTTFSPNSAVTRAMVWAVLARESNATLEEGEQWYSGAQQWAIDNGVSDGLNPLQPVSREELVTMLHRYSNTPTGHDNLSHFTDKDTISSWALDAMKWGVDVGLVSGLDNHTLAPKAGASRSQLATILMRYIENIA